MVILTVVVVVLTVVTTVLGLGFSDVETGAESWVELTFVFDCLRIIRFRILSLFDGLCGPSSSVLGDLVVDP